ncbi:hypothetical protein IRJ41_004357, partial [Triplophysa rosa]
MTFLRPFGFEGFCPWFAHETSATAPVSPFSTPSCPRTFFVLGKPSMLKVPTVLPTTPAPSTTPSDECDDEQANCHSGTGDDYDQTGGTAVPEMTTELSTGP